MPLVSVAMACMVRLGLSFALLFGVAGTLDWPRGWMLFFAVTGLSCLAQSVLAFERPALIRERIRPGSGRPLADRVLSLVIVILFNLWFAAMALETRRFCPAPTIGWLTGLGFGLVLIGQAFSYAAQKSNAFASSVVRIQSDRGQVVVAGGPYRFIRHPMYVGNLLLFFGGTLLVGSWIGFVMAAMFAVLFIIRIEIEERALQAGLPEYASYVARVRWRLIPFLW